MRIVEGGPLEVPNETLPVLLWRVADDASRAHEGGYWFRAHADADWTRWSWRRVRGEVECVTAGLLAAGLAPGDRVAIWSDTCVEWPLAKWAILAAGGVVVPVYPTLAPEQVAHVLGDAGCRFLFVADEELLATLPTVPAAIQRTWRFSADGGDDLAALRDAGNAGLTEDADLVVNAMGRIQPDGPAFLLYTSGTTGTPKGARLTHRNWVASTHANVVGLGLDRLTDPSVLAYLPMAHVAGLAATIAVTSIGGVIAWSHPTRLVADLPTVRPTLMMGVPRIFERIVDRIDAATRDGPALRRVMWQRTAACATAVGVAMANGGRAGPLLRLRHGFWDRLVGQRLRRRLGFDRVEVGLVGAAAVRPDLLHLLQGLRLNIVEAYGLTESTGLVTSNPFAAYRAGTVGLPMPGVRVALGDDDEVLLAGPAVFAGYHGDAAHDDAAARHVDAEGTRWLRTGDAGALDDDGYLTIVDRIKELEVLDTGKMVAPLRVEEQLRGASPLIEDAVAIGHGRKYMAALIQPNYDALIDWARRHGHPHDDAATGVTRRPGPTGDVAGYGADMTWLHLPDIRAAIADAVAAANGHLADFERVKRFDLLPAAFTVDDGDLTPTFKKRRRAILAKNAARVDALFEAA